MLAFATALGPNDMSMDLIPTKAIAPPYDTSIWQSRLQSLDEMQLGGQVDVITQSTI
ncbi:hypothetical protein D3C76_1771010 [compost metagenome]